MGEFTFEPSQPIFVPLDPNKVAPAQQPRPQVGNSAQPATPDSGPPQPPVDPLASQPPIDSSSSSYTPFPNSWGFQLHYRLRMPLKTSISEGGIGHSGGVSVLKSETPADWYAFTFEGQYANTDQMLFPTNGSVGTSGQHEHTAFTLGFGRIHRTYANFGSGNNLRFSINFGVTPVIGYGKSNITQGDRTLAGQNYSFAGKGASTTDIGTYYNFTGYIPLGSDMMLGLGAGLYYGLQYEKQYSEFNRVRLDLIPLNLTLGYGGMGGKEEDGADRELGTMGILWGVYAILNGFGQRKMFEDSLSAPLQALDEYGLMGGGGGTNRGSLYDVPFLQAMSAFTGGLGGTAGIQLRSGDAGYWGLGALNTVGNAAFLSSKSDQTKGSAGAGLLGSLRLFCPAIAGIHTPAERRRHERAEVNRSMMYCNLAAAGLGVVVTGLGGALDSDATVKSGNGSMLPIGMSPDATEGNMVESTEYGFVPVSYYSSDTSSGSRSGIVIHQNWRDFPSRYVQFFSGARLISPMLNAGGSAYYGLNTDVGGTIGIEGKNSYIGASLGVDTVGTFGGGKASRGGVGGAAGLHLTIPFNGKEDGSGIALGLTGTAHKMFPQGYQYEVLPWIGAQLAL